MRLMSFALTTEQIRNRTKRVTRRTGWTFLKLGQLIQPVNKVMGFRAGEKPAPIGGPIRIVSIRREQLDHITKAEVVLEGFPEMTPAEFVQMFVRSHVGSAPWWDVTRIEFEYVDEVPA